MIFSKSIRSHYLTTALEAGTRSFKPGKNNPARSPLTPCNRMAPGGSQLSPAVFSPSSSPISFHLCSPEEVDGKMVSLKRQRPPVSMCVTMSRCTAVMDIRSDGAWVVKGREIGGFGGG